MILLEGNIAAGKSTLGRSIAEDNRMAFIEEPVSSWQNDFEENLLDMFYKDSKRWSFTFQLAAFVTRAKTWTEVLEMTDHTNVVLERSIYADRFIFAKNCYESGLLSKTEYQLYCRMWDWLEERWASSPDKIIYLRTPAEICYERLLKRGRAEEKDNQVPLEYLQSLEVLHDEWLLGSPLVIVIDGSEPIELEDFYEQARLKERIRVSVQSKQDQVRQERIQVSQNKKVEGRLRLA